MAATGADMASGSTNASTKANNLVEPSKPPNAYWMWMGDNREKLKNELNCKGNEVSKVAGERWKNMSDADKAPYVKKAETKKAEYEKALQEFISGGGSKAKRKEKSTKEPGEKSKRARTREKREERMASGKPSRPQNAYWIWLSENRPKFIAEAGSGNVGKVGKLAGERWKTLSAAEKAPYEKQAADKKKAYSIQYEKWKASKGLQGADAGDNEDDDAEDEDAEAEE